ncbi:MAG TPA: FISUMP domain-containing protein [Mucilaginibacter sp.]|jgi:uncharacterized protein (TIGR02145 family)
MKKVCLVFITILALASCSKKSDPGPNSNYVTINGTNYSIVVIGGQTWTSVNYNGDGGVNYNNGANDPLNGKLYTIAEARAVKLPNGWRLPTPADFNKLLVAIGAIYQNQLTGNYYISGDLTLKLMSKTGWTGTEGTNQSGFNARPVGIYFGNPDVPFSPSGLFTDFVVDAPSTNGFISFKVSASDAELEYDIYDATARQPVRFVKDN